MRTEIRVMDLNVGCAGFTHHKGCKQKGRAVLQIRPVLDNKQSVRTYC